MLDSIRGEPYRYASRRCELVDVAAPVRRHRLADLLYYLPNNCSEVLQLRLEGYKLKEAAGMLKISVSRARTLETAAIERLQVLCERRMKRAA
jgi:DNA-directed RNA polymerase specialized sigma24 family protein